MRSLWSRIRGDAILTDWTRKKSFFVHKLGLSVYFPGSIANKNYVTIHNIKIPLY